MPRPDETQYRLLIWTGDSGAAERLAAQVLLASGFQDPDPSHPYGGPDGGRDAIFTRDGELWVMAVYFPHGEKSFSEVKAKFTSDIESAKKHQPKGVAFVTNQEITLGERKELIELVDSVEVMIFHMERVAGLLDQPSMVGVRQQFLGIDPGSVPLNLQLKIGGPAYLAVDGGELREGLLEIEDKSDREAAASPRSASPAEERRWPILAGVLNQEPPPPPPTPEEVEAAIIARRTRVEKDWGRIDDYIIGLTYPAEHFTITNVAKSFLHDVRVVITFAGAHGAEKLQVDDFEDEKLLDPDYERPLSIYESPIYTFKPKGYPIEWRNKDSGLEVRITLPELPPGRAFEWDSEHYEDVIVVANSDEPVQATWQAVAQTYGTPFIGPAIEVPIQKFSAIEAIGSVIRQHDDD